MGALATLALLLLNPPLGAARRAPPIIALDVSQSWLRATDSSAWLRARSAALRAAGDSVLLVGHTVRFGAPPALPADSATLVNRAAERAQLAGRPLVLHSDGEAAEEVAASTFRLPDGSRIEVGVVARRPDLAIVAFDAPAAAMPGDSVRLRLTVAAGQRSPEAASLAVSVDGRVVARLPLQPFEPFQRRAESLVLRLPPGPPRARLQAVVQGGSDGEPRNDTASRTLRRGEQLRAVAISTSPDFDFRETARALRGALSLPTVVRSRVAPSRWVDDRGRTVPESQVRAEFAAGHVVLLHGDTSFFGPPRRVAAGALLLVPFPNDDREWYLESAARSPVSGTLGTLPFDSLPPVAADSAGSSGPAVPLLVVRAAAQRTQYVGALTDSTRRVIVAPIRGTARWALRGGTQADAFATLWGSFFAALAERPGRAYPADPVTLPPAELHPRRATLQAGPVTGGRPLAGGRRPLREYPLVYALLVIFLCAEWVLRRRIGLR